MNFFQKINPRTQALLTVGVVIIALTLVFLFILMRQQQQTLSDTIHREQHSLEKQITLLLDQTSRNYKSRIKSLIATKTQVIKAFAAKDRDELLLQATQLLKIFKIENIYFQSFFFIDPDNLVFLRVHNPDLYGDDVSHISPIIQESNRTKKMVDGFEIVKHGLQYRIVHPVFVDKKFIGLIGFGLDVKFFLDQLHPADHGHLHQHNTRTAGIALIFPKTELKKTILFDQIYKTIGRYAVFGYGNPYFQKLPKHINLEKKMQQIKLNGINHVLMVSDDFKDFKGNVIAGGLSILNIENIILQTKRDLILTIIFAAGLLCFAFVLLYFNFTLLFKKIMALNHSLEQHNRKLEERVEERRAEMRESEERFRLLFDEMPDAIFTIAMDDRILDANHAATRMLGYTRKEFQAMTLADIQAPEARDTPGRTIQNELIRGKFFEGMDLHKNGNLVPIEIHNHKMQLKDQPMVVSVVRDISQRKQAEDQLRKSKAQLQQAQKMEAIGTLAGGIAHDFNNILSGIFGFSQLAKNHIATPEKAKKDIDQIIKGAKKAGDLVQQILTYSRKSTNETQPFQMSVVIKEALKLLRSSIPTTIEIKENIVSTSTVMADPAKIHQVIMNLATNAYHSMQETGGRLTVGLIDTQMTGREDINGRKIVPGNYLRLEVSDTGPGMDPEILNKIFDPYFTTKGPGKGTGMGLAVVHGIVEEHKGHIQVGNKSGQGSVFQVYFPISEKPVPSILPEKTKELAGGSEQIMMIDDEESILEVTQMFLQQYGYRVTPFSGGAQALEVFKKDPYLFDLIITDMTMPGMTGEKLSVEMLKIRSNLPIILCSGYSEKISGPMAMALGIRKFMEKPLLMNDLARVIRDLLDDNNEQ